jgi:hypothetical protein
MTVERTCTRALPGISASSTAAGFGSARPARGLGEDIDPGATVAASVAARQMLAIAKALTRDAKVSRSTADEQPQPP